MELPKLLGRSSLGPLGTQIPVSNAACRASNGLAMLVTRKVEFSASHVCCVPGWEEARNRAVFGDEANPHGHGHNYVLEVTLEGRPDPITGMVIDLKEVKSILEAEIVDPMDHRFLNYEVPPFDRIVPTTPNLAAEIWRRLSSRFVAPGVSLHRVRLFETPDLYVDVLQEDASLSSKRLGDVRA